MKKNNVYTHVDFKSIKSPSFLRFFNYDQLGYLSEEIRSYIVDSVSKNGGHLSSNLGVVESTIALCRVFDFTKDKIIFDVGHQSYTYKILTGRSLDNLRQKDGVSGFQRRHESKYDHYEAGHSSTSIAAANGMAIVRDLKKEKYDITAFIGDAAISNGLAFESLNDVGLQKHKLIIVLNDNEMAIGKPVGFVSRNFRKLSTSHFYESNKNIARKILLTNKVGKAIYAFLAKIKNFIKRHVLKINIFDNLGLAYIGPVDGHNIAALEKAFNRAKKMTRTVVVHIKTIKGKGYEFSENDPSGLYHGVGKFNKFIGITKDETLTWSKLYAKELNEQLHKNEKAIAIVPATGLGSGFDIIESDVKNRVIDVGIAEEYALTLASGISISNYHPFISMYSTFLQRGYDEISHDLSRMNLNATILIDRAGLVGADGTTHQGIYDEAFLYTIPNTVIAMASNSGQIPSLMNESTKNHGVFCIRYSKDECRHISDLEEVPFGKWKLENDGHNTAVISVGPETEDLKEEIKTKKLDITLYNAIYQRPLDSDALNAILKYKKVIVYDAYGVVSGFAKEVSSYLALNHYKGQIIIKALPNAFIHHASIKEQKEEYHVTIADVLELL